MLDPDPELSTAEIVIGTPEELAELESVVGDLA